MASKIIFVVRMMDIDGVRITSNVEAWHDDAKARERVTYLQQVEDRDNGGKRFFFVDPLSLEDAGE